MSGNDSSASGQFSRWLDPIDMQPQQIIRVVFLGAFVGLLFWGTSLFLHSSLLSPVLCVELSNDICAESLAASSGIATIIVAIVGLLGLVRFGVFRPLLVVIAVSISLWGLGVWLQPLAWYEAMSWSILLYALQFIAFAWLARFRLLAPALIAIAVVVLTARIIVTVQTALVL